MSNEKVAGGPEITFDPAGGGDETAMMVVYPRYMARIVSRETIEDGSRLALKVQRAQAAMGEAAMQEWRAVMDYRQELHQRRGEKGARAYLAALRDSVSVGRF